MANLDWSQCDAVESVPCNLQHKEKNPPAEADGPFKM